ncbi:MAG: malonyl-CoA decarboxylase family protein [Burkholderiaceae bacterium]
MLKRLLKSSRSESQGALLDQLLALCLRLGVEHFGLDDQTNAAQALALYECLTQETRERLFHRLATDFGPDSGEIARLARRYSHSELAQDLVALRAAMESPRMRILRRLSRVPAGAATIVQMRAALLNSPHRTSELAAFGDEIRQHLQLWFDPGFLTVERVDWQSPASLLDQLMQHEAVHQIDGWSDLRRRLASDRRCFAFFHPVMPQSPLFFVEVALLNKLPEAIAPLLDRRQQADEQKENYRVAAFYSISNCQPGLRGVHLGSVLVQQVIAALREELPELETFCTLSPVPGFAAWLNSVRRLDSTRVKPQLVKQLNEDLQDLRAQFGSDLNGLVTHELDEAKRHCGDPQVPHTSPSVQQMRRWEDQSDAPANAMTGGEQHPLRVRHEQLRRLCAFYLTEARAGISKIVDDEARFHLRNGASLEQIYCRANMTESGLQQSFGLMASYRYCPKELERHRLAALDGQVACSRTVRALLRPLRAVR